MKKIIFLIALLISSSLFSQGEANNWFFGQNASVNFNSTPPTTGTGSLNTNEGCSSFSDTNGNLLFYSDGSTVWDKNHHIMSNGSNLKGHPSSTQSAIIVPKPNDPSIYYLFTVGAQLDSGGEFGFYYYTIDMSKNGGDGAVSSGPVNLGDSYNPKWSEKVTSVKGDDCNSFWVISVVFDSFYAYKVDQTGVASIPVISRVSYNSTSVSRRGYLKVSPDGTKIASATFAYNGYDGGVKNGKLHLYSFNNVTGNVSDNAKVLISNVKNDGEPYGLEFSPNSTFLYCSTMTGTYNKLFQFNLAELDIPSSKTLIHSQVGYRGALQLAPDGKIYVTVPPSYTEGTHYLHIINNPEGQGVNCDYKINGLDLTPNYAMQGLPPFIASLLLPIKITRISDTVKNLTNTTVSVCDGETFSITSENIEGVPTYEWFYKGTTFTKGRTLQIPNMSSADDGLYELEVNTIDKCGFNKSFKGSVTLTTVPLPIPVNPTYAQCDFDTNSLDGKTVFNLTLKEAEITNNDPNLSVSFYQTTGDYTNDNSINTPSAFINTTAFSQILLTKVENKTTGCYRQGNISLHVSPTSLSSYPNVYVCENDVNAGDTPLVKSSGTGNSSYNFDGKIAEITALFTAVPVKVVIFSTDQDALYQTNPVTGIKEIESHTYYVRVENKTSKACVAVGTFNTTVNKLPTVTFAQKEMLLCIDNPVAIPETNSIVLTTQFGKTIEYFQWYKDDVLINGATKSTYTANTAGNYFVEAYKYYINDPTTNIDDTYCVGYGSIKVNVSNPALIQDKNVTIIDDVPNNLLSINNIKALGFGDYEYSIDINKTKQNYQDSPEFEYITPGFHTLYIRDKNGCGISSKKFTILAYPKYFTPNNDGVNDQWTLLGLDHTKYRSANLQIFDRFGKVIKRINLNGDAWDGSYNGKILQSDDYWFIVELIDLNNVRIIKKGHFSLLRS